jgi:type IV pilus assembly protein PilP
MHSTTLALALLLGLAGCDDEPIQVGRGVSADQQGPVAPGTPGAPGGEGPGQAIEDEPDAGPAIPSYRDEDFVEADTNRDPFRNYASMFSAQAPEMDRGRRDVIMPDTGVDEMRVIGIVSGVANPRAMLVDRGGVGHVVRRGQYIGRSEVVQAGGTEELPVTLNWRVDRIRPNEVVLTREDPTAPNRPPLTRMLPLRDEEDELALRGVRPVSSESAGQATGN